MYRVACGMSILIENSRKLPVVLGRWLQRPRLPWALALAAVFLMLPALSTDLLGDDVIQRLTQFKASDLPSRSLETGFVSKDAGQFWPVLRDLFGYPHGEAATVRARDYGIAPWWAHPGWRASLFRPVTAFTHWLDYRVFPKTPALMHFHSILWFASAVFLAATIYRRIAGFNAAPRSLVRAQKGYPSEASRGSSSANAERVFWVPGIAACLFCLDKNTFFPVMYVANRGFIIALVFGLLCLLAHLNWRESGKTRWMWASSLALALSLVANEGGASTLAFLLAFALVLEPAGWRGRILSLLPATSVVLVWRSFYVASGFGVRNFLLYIDPGYAPWPFLKNLLPRAIGLLGGQLTGLPPEMAMALNATCQLVLALFFACFTLLFAVAVFPFLVKDRSARFWTVVTVLAAVPASTVAPLSKNMAFVSLGAFGTIASLLAGWLQNRESGARGGSGWLTAAISIWLLVVHIPGAIVARVGLAIATPFVPQIAENACALQNWPDLTDRDLVTINDPFIVTAILPFDRAYRGMAMPRSVRILVPGTVPLEVTRTGSSSLTLSAKDSDLFDCPKLGPAHLCYALKLANQMLLGQPNWKVGQVVACKRFSAEILELGPSGLPSRVGFQFDKPLESEEFVWCYFDWPHFTHSKFDLPLLGQTCRIPGTIK